MKKYGGSMKNSTVFSDESGDYLVIDRDTDGNEYKVYLTKVVIKKPRD